MGLLLIFTASPLLRALDPPTSFTLSFPLPANLVTPAWLGQPQSPETTFATLNLPVLTPDPNASLLVTVFFQEKSGGFLRIGWQGTQGAQILSENFYEGIGMSNQRSLLISPETLLGDGTLSFQCGGNDLGIAKIRLEWLETRNGAVSPQIQDLMVTPETGPTQPSRNLSGLPASSDPAAWHGQLVTVPITDLPQRIEDGVEFSVKMDHLPNAGRLSLQETGLPLGQHLVVWINEQRAGTITPAVPDLADGGYDSTLPSNGYVGWRDGSFYIPASLLKTGENTLLFSTESDTSPAADASTVTSPLAIKDLVFQLSYPNLTPDNSAAAPTPTPTPDPVAPTGPVTDAPDDSSVPENPTSPPDLSTPGDTARALQPQVTAPTLSPLPGSTPPAQDDQAATPTPIPTPTPEPVASPSSSSNPTETTQP